MQHNQNIKKALVSGASSGIGFAIVKHLLELGWQVTALSRHRPELIHDNLIFVSVDLLQDDFCEELNGLSGFDAIICAAGIMKTDPITSLNPAEGDMMWRLHVLAPIKIVNTFISSMADGGRIILIGSRTANGVANRSQYAATKSALIGLSRSWALELLSRQITVNIISPGATETPMLSDPARRDTPPKIPPMGHFIQPIEIAGMVEFLLTDYAISITGQNIVVCGGASL